MERQSLFKRILKKIKSIFTESGFAVITVFIWEILEEGLEELIAYGLANLFAKTLVVVGVTIITKKFIFKISKPIIKTFTYKEGTDKMTKFKKFLAKIKEGFTWIFSNKKTLSGIASGIALTLTGTGVIDVSSLPEIAIKGFNITPILYYGVLLIATLIGISGKGFETIKQFAERIAKQKEEKENNKLVKEAKAELKAEQKLANQTQAQKEKEDAKKIAEAKAKQEKAIADAKHRAKLDAIKAELKNEK